MVSMCKQTSVAILAHSLLSEILTRFVFLSGRCRHRSLISSWLWFYKNLFLNLHLLIFWGLAAGEFKRCHIKLFFFYFIRYFLLGIGLPLLLWRYLRWPLWSWNFASQVWWCNKWRAWWIKGRWLTQHTLERVCWLVARLIRGVLLQSMCGLKSIRVLVTAAHFWVIPVMLLRGCELRLRRRCIVYLHFREFLKAFVFICFGSTSVVVDVGHFKSLLFGFILILSRVQVHMNARIKINYLSV